MTAKPDPAWAARGAAALFAIGVAHMVLHAFAVLCLWQWFAMPIGAPSIGLAQAFGLSLLAKMGAGADYAAVLDESSERAWRRVGHAFGRPVIALIAGWVVSP